jgi:hypothetical protein
MRIQTDGFIGDADDLVEAVADEHHIDATAQLPWIGEESKQNQQACGISVVLTRARQMPHKKTGSISSDQGSSSKTPLKLVQNGVSLGKMVVGLEGLEPPTKRL